MARFADIVSDCCSFAAVDCQHPHGNAQCCIFREFTSVSSISCKSTQGMVYAILCFKFSLHVTYCLFSLLVYNLGWGKSIDHSISMRVLVWCKSKYVLNAFFKLKFLHSALSLPTMGVLMLFFCYICNCIYIYVYMFTR